MHWEIEREQGELRRHKSIDAAARHPYQGLGSACAAAACSLHGLKPHDDSHEALHGRHPCRADSTLMKQALPLLV